MVVWENGGRNEMGSEGKKMVMIAAISKCKILQEGRRSREGAEILGSCLIARVIFFANILCIFFRPRQKENENGVRVSVFPPFLSASHMCGRKKRKKGNKAAYSLPFSLGGGGIKDVYENFGFSAAAWLTPRPCLGQGAPPSPP